jgi:hypothetical protein
MSISFNIDGTFYYSSRNQRTRILDMIGSDQEILYTLPIDEKPFDPAGEIMVFNRDSSSTFIPLNSLTPGTATCYGTFSGNPINNIPPTTTANINFTQTTNTPRQNINTNPNQNITIQYSGNYYCILDCDATTGAQGQITNGLYTILKNGVLLNSALTSNTTYKDQTITSIICQSLITVAKNDIISVVVYNQGNQGNFLSINNLTLTLFSIALSEGSETGNSLLNANPSAQVSTNSLCIFTGDDKFSCESNNALVVDNENIINVNNGLRIRNTAENPIYNSIMTNEDDGLDIVNYNEGGEITLATNTATITVGQMVRWFNNINSVLSNLTNINILN